MNKVDFFYEFFVPDSVEIIFLQCFQFHSNEHFLKIFPIELRYFSVESPFFILVSQRKLSEDNHWLIVCTQSKRTIKSTISFGSFGYRSNECFWQLVSFKCDSISAKLTFSV